jgi:hypothetical protein
MNGKMGNGKLRRDEETRKEEMGEGRKDGKSKGRDKRKKGLEEVEMGTGKRDRKKFGKVGI